MRLPEAYFRFKGLISHLPEVYLRFEGLLIHVIGSINGYTSTSFRRFRPCLLGHQPLEVEVDFQIRQNQPLEAEKARFYGVRSRRNAKGSSARRRPI